MLLSPGHVTVAAVNIDDLTLVLQRQLPAEEFVGIELALRIVLVCPCPWQGRLYLTPKSMMWYPPEMTKHHHSALV